MPPLLNHKNKSARRAPRARLGLECLDDRRTPSSLTHALGIDDGDSPLILRDETRNAAPQVVNFAAVPHEDYRIGLPQEPDATRSLNHC